jgi:capsid protein
VIQANIPGPQFDQFTSKVATWSASPLGLPSEDILNTYAGMNFSSSKASRVSSQRGKKKTQDYIIERYIEPVRELVIEEAWLRGYLLLPGFEDPVKRRAYLQHVTHPSPWQDLEPVKEETASKLRLANKTTSLTRECAMRGINLRTLLREWQREKQEFERAGIPLPAYLMEPPDPMAKAPGTPPAPPQAGGNKAKEKE